MSALTALLLLVLLVGAPALAYSVGIILARAAVKTPRIHALRERAILAVVMALVATVFAIAVINTEVGHPAWSEEAGHVIVRVAFGLLMLIPNGYWLILYLTKGFRDYEG